MNFYRQMQFLLFFFDVDNFSSSLNNLNHFYEEANTACNCDIKFAIIVYGDDIPNMNEIRYLGQEIPGPKKKKKKKKTKQNNIKR